MKCNARKYFWSNKKKKNGDKIIHSVVSVRGMDSDEISWFEKRFSEQKNIDPNFEVCSGDVFGEIVAVDEPYMGGTSAELEVNYHCTECTCNHYKDLPSKYNISAFLNDWLNKHE